VATEDGNIGQTIPMTEAEYAAAVMERRAHAVVGELNKRLGGSLPDGMRFEWAPHEEG